MIEVKNLNITIAKNKIVNDVSLTLGKNDFVFLLGKNGIGKSTFLKALVGLNDYTGELKVGGRDIQTIGHKSRSLLISYISQNTLMNLDLSVGNFFEYSRYSLKSFPSALSEKEIEELKELVCFFEFDIGMERKLSTLSGGELQKCLVISTFFQETKVILLDESFSWLDPHQKIELIKKIKLKAEELDICVICVTHDLNLALEHGTTFLLANDDWKKIDKKNLTKEIIDELYDYNFEIIDTQKSFIVKSNGVENK
ncbi:MAG: ABC transporter ATP-binding protein [Oligoflexia bacterium]|nr:ABC transporter ATP-binding protein [Oligoflexia bacterium]